MRIRTLGELFYDVCPCLSVKYLWKTNCVTFNPRNVAKAFYAASVLMEVCQQFGALSSDVYNILSIVCIYHDISHELYIYVYYYIGFVCVILFQRQLDEKLKYSQWKAGDISKALREGRVPQSGSLSDSNVGTDGSTMDLGDDIRPPSTVPTHLQATPRSSQPTSDISTQSPRVRSSSPSATISSSSNPSAPMLGYPSLAPATIGGSTYQTSAYAPQSQQSQAMPIYVPVQQTAPQRSIQAAAPQNSAPLTSEQMSQLETKVDACVKAGNIKGNTSHVVVSLFHVYCIYFHLPTRTVNSSCIRFVTFSRYWNFG